MNANIRRGLVAVGVLTTVGSSFAAAPDVTGVVTEISLLPAAVGLVGAAILLVYVAVKGFKFIRAAMS